MLKILKTVWGGAQKGLAWVGEKIAMVVTPVFLTLFYFTVIAIAGLVVGLSRSDLLHRRAGGNPTFWFPKPKEHVDEKRYRAQF